MKSHLAAQGRGYGSHACVARLATVAGAHARLSGLCCNGNALFFISASQRPRFLAILSIPSNPPNCYPLNRPTC